MSESQNSPPPQLGTNSSSVAIAILVPFFALIFTGFGFYLYKQRYELKKTHTHSFEEHVAVSALLILSFILFVPFKK